MTSRFGFPYKVYLAHFPSELLTFFILPVFTLPFTTISCAVLNVLKISFALTGMEYNALLDLVYP